MPEKYRNLKMDRDICLLWFPGIGDRLIDYRLHRFIASDKWAQAGNVSSAIDVHTFDSLRELPVPEKRPFSWRRWRNRET